MTGDVLRFDPRLAEEINRLDMRIRYRGHALDVHLTHDTLTVRSRDAGPPPIRVGLKDAVYELAAGNTLEVETHMIELRLSWFDASSVELNCIPI